MTQKEFLRLNRRIVAFGGKRKSREEAHMREGSGRMTIGEFKRLVTVMAYNCGDDAEIFFINTDKEKGTNPFLYPIGDYFETFAAICLREAKQEDEE